MIRGSRKEQPTQEQVRALASALGLPTVPPGGGPGSSVEGGTGSDAVSAVGSSQGAILAKVVGGLLAATLVGGGILFFGVFSDEPIPETPGEPPTAQVVNEPENLPDELTHTPEKRSPAQIRATQQSPPQNNVDPRTVRVESKRIKQLPSPDRDDNGGIKLLWKANSLLGSNPRKSLEIVRRHQKLYPRSQHVQERDVIEIEAMMRLGQTHRARNKAQRFARRWPRSFHLRRIRKIVGPDIIRTDEVHGEED